MKFTFSTFLAFSIIFSSCGGKYSSFPLDKRFWTPEDYSKVVNHIRYKTDKDERLPTFDNPESRIVLEKLTDKQNYLVVLGDDELGLTYRNEVAEKFFREWKYMNKIYWQMDRQDKYVYPVELVECFKFGLGLQLHYFKLGNDNIIENAIDPNSYDTRRVVNGNVSTLIGNYEIFLNIVSKEDAFSDDALIAYSDGVEEYFTKLIDLYPAANYNGIRKQLELLKNKMKSEYVTNSYSSIIQLIDVKKQEAEAAS